MQISIVGCGWLGLPLALSLKESGHNIVATTRSKQKCADLTDLGLEAVQFSLADQLPSLGLSAIFASQILVLNIPVGRKQINTDFLAHMKAFLTYAKTTDIKNVIFISTTSVYGDTGKKVTATSPVKPQTHSAKINTEVEQLLQQLYPDSSTIIRLAGLVGQNRHPVHFLAGKKSLPNGNHLVNLIHQEDVITAIQCIISKSLWQHTLVLSAKDHPTRQQYYKWAAKTLGLARPEFIQQPSADAGKYVDASGSLEILGLSLKYPSPYDMI